MSTITPCPGLIATTQWWYFFIGKKTTLPPPPPHQLNVITIKAT